MVIKGILQTKKIYFGDNDHMRASYPNNILNLIRS